MQVRDVAVILGGQGGGQAQLLARN